MNLSEPYASERQTLRLRLQANRLLLTYGTDGLLSVHDHDDEFPRSITMRFLSNTPGLFTFLIADVAPFLLGRFLTRRRRRK